ncbi:MAG: FmdB family zinc ribbon protein, partial [Thermodesulfobacteriota bacterium]
MPTYQYRAINLEACCDHCKSGFEVIQRMSEPALSCCPLCKGPVCRVIFA